MHEGPIPAEIAVTPGVIPGSPLATLPARPRIAIFRALQLGDMLCLTPALQALRQARPDAEVTLIGLPWASGFQQRYHRWIDGFVPFPGHPAFPEQGVERAAWRGFLRQMQARRFDLALQVHGSGPHANRIVTALGARHLAAFHPAGSADDPQLRKARGGRTVLAWLPHEQEPRRYVRLVQRLGARASDDHLFFPLEARDDEEADDLIAAFGLDPRRMVIVHPGARMLSRRWPVERFGSVCAALAGQGWQVVLTGAGDEAALTANLRAHSPCRIVDLAGRTTLGGLAALLRRARLLICNDTGVSHVAVAMATPSVVVASGSDMRRWAPRETGLHLTLGADMPCRPCDYQVCPFGHGCALGVESEDVLHIALQRLVSGGSDRA